MKDYVIQPKEEGKGRSFQATCLAVITADVLFPESRGASTIRPIWAMFAGSDTALRPFAANLRTGRKAEPEAQRSQRGGDGDRLEFLRSVGYLTSWQREPEGSLLTIYHPELFRLDPGLVDPQGLNFVLLVPSDWSDAQAVDAASAVRHVNPLYPKLEAERLASLVPTAYLFAAYLDRRTRCPLVADGRFYLQLLVASLDLGIASLPGTSIKYHNDRGEWGHGRHQFDVDLFGVSYREDSLAKIGVKHGISFHSTHETFEAFLAEQVTLYFERVRGKARRVQKVDLSRFTAVDT